MVIVRLAEQSAISREKSVPSRNSGEKPDNLCTRILFRYLLQLVRAPVPASGGGSVVASGLSV